MLEKEYEQLVEYLKGMIVDGVQLVHGGHLLDWQDTHIYDLIQTIDKKKSDTERLTIEVAEPLRNRISGDRVNVIYITENTVQISPNKPTFIYPKDKIWYHYRKEEADE